MSEIIQYKKHTIKIERDNDPIDPREDDNLGTMVCSHRNYMLGDKQCGDTGLLTYLDQKYNIIKPRHTEQYDTVIKKWFERNVISLPLYLFDHSGVTMSTTPFFNNRWDSGQVGVIYVLKKDVRKEFNITRISKRIREHVVMRLCQEVKTYDEYLTGNVWGYVCDDEIKDSYWGYLGNSGKEQAIVDAKAVIDWHVQYRTPLEV